jgi:NAD(P)-dependent dehydrogenase (short-subunit alcohol dehydrogenase family)
VFEFLGTECPIAGRVQPELERLAQEFGPQGVRFVAIYPNVGETASGIRKHRSEAGQTVEAGLDPGHRLTDRLAVTVTPEVVVLASDGRLIYQGRVNDQYGALGKGRPAPTRHDVAEALGGFLASGQATAIRTTPVGCRIQRLP